MIGVWRNWNQKQKKGATVLLALLLAAWLRQLGTWQPHFVGYQSSSPPPFDTNYSVAKISPNGRLLYMDDGKAMNARIWDLEQETLVCEFPFYSRQVVFAPDSKSAFFWNPFDWREGAVFSTDKGIKKDEFFLSYRNVNYFRVLPGYGELIFLNGSCVWRPNTPDGNQELKCPSAPLVGFSSLSADGSQAIMSTRGGVRIFDTRSGEELHFFPGLRGAVGISPDKKVFWNSDDRDHVFEIRGSQNGALLWKLETDKAKFQFTPDSQFLALATGNGLEYRDILSGNTVKRFSGPRAAPFDISPDGSFAVSCEPDGRILRWRLK